MKSGWHACVRAEQVPKAVVAEFIFGLTAQFTVELTPEEAEDLGLALLQNAMEVKNPGYRQRQKDKAAALREALRKAAES